MTLEDEIAIHAKECQTTRATLPLGEWTNEPDRVEFKHLGLDCLLSRNPFGFNWCGYVGVPKNHPFFGRDYSRLRFEVHGGLSYSRECNGHLCHGGDSPSVSASVTLQPIWWFGFDCGHAYDLRPGDAAIQRAIGLRPWVPPFYRNKRYVTTETEKLASQLTYAAEIAAAKE